MSVTGWSSRPTLGGMPLTSRLSGKRIAASDHCVATITTCARCFERFYRTPEAPTCPNGCAPDPPSVRGQAPTIVTGL